MRITITKRGEKVVRSFEVTEGIARAIEDLLLAMQYSKIIISIQRGVNPTWLAAARRTVK